MNAARWLLCIGALLLGALNGTAAQAAPEKASKPPQTFLWRGEQLMKVKNSLATGDTTYADAYQSLCRDADKRLRAKNPSVMEKDLTPPSGDKHDYVSMGRYWWPNPNTPDSLPYIRRDGKSNPEIRNYDRGRLGSLGSAVSTLAIAHYLSGESKYAEKANDMLRTWFLDPKTRMNPNLNFGQFVPGHNDNKGRGTGIIDTASFLSLVDGIQLLKDRNAIPQKDYDAIKTWFAAYLKWMIESDIGKDEQKASNNHGTAYDLQVASFALFTGNTKLAHQTIRDFPKVRIFAQVEPDGKMPMELARATGMGYSTFNLGFFLDMSDIAYNQKITLYPSKSKDGRCIDAAMAYLAQFVGKPVTEFPYKQTSGWEGAIQDAKSCLYRAHRFNPKAGYLKQYEASSPQKPSHMFVLRFM